MDEFELSREDLERNKKRFLERLAEENIISSPNAVDEAGEILRKIGYCPGNEPRGYSPPENNNQYD